MTFFEKDSNMKRANIQHLSLIKTISFFKCKKNEYQLLTKTTSNIKQKKSSCLIFYIHTPSNTTKTVMPLSPYRLRNRLKFRNRQSNLCRTSLMLHLSFYIHSNNHFIICNFCIKFEKLRSLFFLIDLHIHLIHPPKWASLGKLNKNPSTGKKYYTGCGCPSRA